MFELHQRNLDEGREGRGGGVRERYGIECRCGEGKVGVEEGKTHAYRDEVAETTVRGIGQ